MIRHLAYLIGCEARNRLRRQAARLRDPRYALALLVGLAYFFFAFGGPRALRGGSAGGEHPLFDVIRELGPLALAIYAAITWIYGRSDALAFRPAEIAFLLTGPLTRRDLLRYKLLHAQVPLLFSTSFMTLVSHGTVLPWYLRLPSFWVLLSILHLHHTAAALVHAAAEQAGLVGWRRNWLPVTLFAAAAIVIVSSVNRALASPAAAGIQSVFAALDRALEQPLPMLVLAPFRFALAPLVTPAPAWLPAFGIALLVLLAHYAWVLRSNAAFEEAATEAGERRARAVSVLRGGGGWRAYSRALKRGRGNERVAAPPFHLALSGEPGVAITWKNLTFARRNTSLASPVMIGVIAAVFVSLSSVNGGSMARALEQVGFIALAFGAFLVVFGPVMVRNDLRMDLRMVELLRTLPLPPHRLVSAELAASAITASIIQLSVLLLGGVLLLASGDAGVGPAEFAVGTVAAVLLLPALTTLGVTIQCAIALTFPAWVHLGRERSAGVEAMGQNILTMVGSVLLLALLLVPPALLLLASVILLGPVLGWVAPVAGGVVAVAAIYAEVWLAARGLGRLFARTDPSEVGLAR